MAYGYTAQANNGSAGSGTTLTVSFAVGASDTVIEVWAAYSGVVSTLNLSDGTHTYSSTGGGGSVASTVTHRMVTGYVLAPTPGSYTLTMTLGGARANRRLAVVTHSGVNAFQAATSQGQIGAATTTDAVSTSSMTPSSQPAMLAAVSFTANGTATYTAGTGHTSRGVLSNWDALGLGSTLLEDIRLTSTSAVSGLFTIGTSRDTLSSGLIFTETASADATVSGQTLTASASVVAGTATAGSSVASQVLSATASLVAGAAQAASSVAGQVLAAAASLISGTAFANDAAVSGQTLTASASLVSGGAAGDQAVTRRGGLGLRLFLGL